MKHASAFGGTRKRIIHDRSNENAYAGGDLENYEPGIKYDIMLCLVGSQGAGKSAFFKYLAIKEESFSDNLDTSGR